MMHDRVLGKYMSVYDPAQWHVAVDCMQTSKYYFLLLQKNHVRC